MTDTRRILFVINSLAGGGAERVLSTILRASDPWRDRYAMALALLDDEPRAYDPPPWIELFQLHSAGRLRPSLNGLRDVVRQWRPDASLSFLTRANVANGFAMVGRRRPWVISERVDTSAHLGSGVGGMAAKALVRLVYPRADRIIAVSDGVAEGLVAGYGVDRARIVTAANPVDHALIEQRAAEPAAIPLPDNYVVAAGRLAANKNWPLLLRAFARSGLPGSLLIVGEGPERGRIMALVDRLGLAGRVIMPGFVENPFALFARASLFALPSNAEGFPNGLVEAMACSLPVVSTNCPSGPSEILASAPRSAIQGLTLCDAGALVPPDDVDAFTEALRLVSDPQRRAARSAAARERSRAYGVDRATAQYWRVIESALDGRSRHGDVGRDLEVVE